MSHAAGAVPFADDAPARELAAEILRRPEYARWRSFEEGEWITTVTGGIGSALEWLIALPVRQPTLYWALEIGLLIVAAVLIARVGGSIRAAMNASAAPRTAPKAESGRDWLRDADAAARAERFLDAAHSLQIATLESLLRSGRLSLARSDPNRVLRERLQRAPLDEALRARLLHALGRLEAAWFRGDRADSSLYVEWRSLFADVAGATRVAGTDR